MTERAGVSTDATCDERSVNSEDYPTTHLETIAQLRRELAEARKWANCGGVPSGRTCTFDPNDKHQIYGGGQTLQDGSHICDVHAVKRAYEQLATERQRAERLQANCVSWAERCEMGWRGLQNIYSAIEGRECDQAVALGLATSAVVRLKQRAERAEALAEDFRDRTHIAENRIETLTSECKGYCHVCGMEDTCEDPLPSCPGVEGAPESGTQEQLKRERDQALLERDGIEAGAAVLREALEFVEAFFQRLEDGSDGSLLDIRRKFHAPVKSKINAALSTTAGADILKRLSEAEKAAGEEAICKRNVTDKYADYCIERNEHVTLLDAAKKRIIQLEEENEIVWTHGRECGQLEAGKRITQLEAALRPFADIFMQWNKDGYSAEGRTLGQMVDALLIDHGKTVTTSVSAFRAIEAALSPDGKPADPEDCGYWRVGGKVPLNVYERDRPMFQCHTPEDARRIVDLLNAACGKPAGGQA